MSRSSTLAMCITLCSLAPTRAEIIIVTSDSGGTGGPGCTLRDAITAANTDTPTGGCPAGNGADTIELPASVSITLTDVDNVAIDGDNGLPRIASVVTINGNGATIERSSADGTPYFRIFYVSAELVLNNASVTNGDAAGYGNDGAGGGLHISFGATVLLSGISVSGNSAYIGGGGIVTNGASEVTLTNCMIDGNSGGALGGGILNGSTEAGLLIANTTVCGNTPDQIVGDYIDGGGNLILNDCTPCTGDFNGDDEVGPIDLAYLLGFWGACPESCEPGDPLTTCATDLTGDCDVEAFDLALLLGNWGPCE